MPRHRQRILNARAGHARWLAGRLYRELCYPSGMFWRLTNQLQPNIEVATSLGAKSACRGLHFCRSMGDVPWFSGPFRRRRPALFPPALCVVRTTKDAQFGPLLVADYDRIRDKIEIVYPDFKDYNRRIRYPGGFRLPLGPTDRLWYTRSSKAEFMPRSRGRMCRNSRRFAATINTIRRSMALTTAIAAFSADATCC
jgi:hypothetical protein